MGGNRCHIDIKSIDKPIIAHITWTEWDDGRAITVTAIALDTDGRKIENITKVRKKVKSKEELELTINQAAEALFSKSKKSIRKTNTKVTQPETDELSSIVVAFRELCNSTTLDDLWAQSTRHKYLKYFGIFYYSDFQ